MPKKTPKERKDRAVKYAEWAAKIDQKHFDKLSKAIKDRHKPEFLKICRDAGIPENVLTDLESDLTYLKSEEGWGGGWGGGWG